VRILIAGCGYLGSALATRLVAGGHRVVGVRRSWEAAAPPACIEPVAADLRDAAALRALRGPFDAVVYAAAPAGGDDAAYRAVYRDGVAAVLEALRCARFLLTSSTSVYGQDAGEWVDEASPTEPASFRGRRVLEGEALAHERHPAACALRLGGLYGPGRTRLLAAARAGRLGAGGAARYTNRIHRDDAAGALAHLLGRPHAAPVYVGVDCEPAAEGELHRWLAARVGAPPPGTPAPGPPLGKRCSNRLLLATGYRFRFPSFREGYGALAAAEERG
jgi:nucleoside-diphosphate-sugar epimerase